MIKFLCSVEGFACMVLIGAVIAGGINEYIYFRNTCKQTIKGFDDLAKDFNDLLSNERR